MIYLDHAAHTPPHPAALEAFISAEKRFCANPISSHGMGFRAAEELAGIREKILQITGLAGYQLYFTSSASEANARAIAGLARERRFVGKHILVSQYEHPSIYDALKNHTDVEYFDPDNLREDTAFAVICHSDAELGLVRELPALPCPLLCDASQSMGKIPLNGLQNAGAVTAAPHKFGGLTGIGLLFSKTELPPIFHSGTPSVGLAAATLAALENRPDIDNELYKYRLLLTESLSDIALFNSPTDGNPYIFNLSFPGVRGEKMRDALSERGVCVSVKSACSPANTPSRAVMARFNDRNRALCSIRLSFGADTTEDDILQLVEISREIYKELT